MRTRIAPLAVALLSSAALAACGSEGDPKTFKEEYSKQGVALRAVDGELDRTLASARSTPPAVLEEQLGSLADRLTPITDELESLSPTPDTEDTVKELRSSVDTVKSDLLRLAEHTRAHDAEQARTTTDELRRDADRVRRTRGSLDQTVSSY